jgi:hypothetical protein
MNVRAIVLRVIPREANGPDPGGSFEPTRRDKRAPSA